MNCVCKTYKHGSEPPWQKESLKRHTRRSADVEVVDILRLKMYFIVQYGRGGIAWYGPLARRWGVGFSTIFYLSP